MNIKIKQLIICVLLINSFSAIHAQQKDNKKNVDAFSYKVWPELTNGTLSNNGKYAFCRISNVSEGREYFLIKSFGRHLQKNLPSGYSQLNFSSDNKSLYAMHGDTLSIFNLQNFSEINIAGCISYELYREGKNEWLIYQLNDIKNTLVTQKLNANITFSFENVKGYFLNPNRQTVVLKIQTAHANLDSLKWVDLKNGKAKIIYTGTAASDFIFDASGQNMAFIVENGTKSIWYYNEKLQNAEKIFSDQSPGIAAGFTIVKDPYWEFSPNGEMIYFGQQLKQIEKLVERGQPEIWNYQDRFMVPLYLARGHDFLTYGENFTILDIKHQRADLVLAGNQRALLLENGKINNNIIIIETDSSQKLSRVGPRSSKASYTLYFTENKKKIELNTRSGSFSRNCKFSPKNNYLIYYDYHKGFFSCYSLTTGLRQDFDNNKKEEFIDPRVLGWTDSTHLLVRGKKDIWLLNARDLTKSRSITGKLNAKGEITFSLAAPIDLFFPYKVSDDILVLGFNSISKRSNVYSLNIKSNTFQESYTSDFFLGEPYDELGYLHRAKGIRKYLLKLGNVSKYPNYYATSDFKSFDTLTNFEPQNNYNWIKSELVKYKNKFGENCEGILYKPTNFDPNKKYPIILNYYLEQSNIVNKYINPEPASDGINIPLLLARGYILMKPNMYPTTNEAGEGALNSALAAVNFLGQFNWADTLKMGVSGHSQGGFETNYIITHSNKFKAALSEAGVANVIENYTDITSDGIGRQDYFFSAYRMLDSLQNAPDYYVKNSPILFTKNITTPLLLVHNDDDHRVEVVQSKQFFNQLYSQNLPVWLLQYKGEKHTLNKESNQLDLQERVLGFFDHYLKGVPMPQWMIDHH